MIISISLFVIGCNDLEKENMEESKMSDEILYDFYSFLRAPKSTEKQGLSEVIKLVFTKNDSSLSDTIAIDVEGKKIHIDPWMSSHGINSLGETKNIDDINEVLNILKKYNIQDWKEDYSFENPSSFEDGFGWNLWLQYKDGTVEKHGGSGSFPEEIIPENFGEFFHELNDFVNERLEEDDE